MRNRSSDWLVDDADDSLRQTNHPLDETGSKTAVQPLNDASFTSTWVFASVIGMVVEIRLAVFRSTASIDPGELRTTASVRFQEKPPQVVDI
jgi:hypothetical protein